MPPDTNTVSDAFLHRIERELSASARFTDPGECWSYGYDNSRRQNPPGLVVLPEEHAEVVTLLQLCREFGIPLTARGRGTGTTGAAVPEAGGVVVSFERMNRILEIAPGDRYVVCEPGVTNQALQDAAGEYGFFWPPDPTSAAFCTIGGNLAYNSAGPRAVKYGTPRENTLGLRAVTGTGASLRTGVRTSKGVVGYDLTRLLIGSEGTLGLITEATLRLQPRPEATITFKAVYHDMGAAARAVSRIMAQPVVPSALEFIDHRAIEMIRRYSEAELPEGAGALLMIEVDGPAACLDAASAAVAEAAAGAGEERAGLLSLDQATEKADVAALWATRKALSPALRQVAPKKINEDVVVPVTRMPELISGLDTLSERFGITIVNFGHAGNGNIHVNLLVDPDDPDEMARAHRCLDEVFGLVLGLGGSLSGEHGVGLEKRDHVDREIDAPTLELMSGLRATFDPAGILNPGKGFPSPT
ncbi:MAG: FAD-binding oxidoreductase [Pseudomonadota bacterium]